MNTKLDYVRDWKELARRAQWSVARMAQLSCVSESTLRRRFLRQMGANPRDWIAGQRLLQALNLLREGSSIKEVSTQLGFEHQTNFTRKFKKYWGQCPTALGSRTPHRPLLAADSGDD